MDGRQISDDSESRCAAFVDGIVSVSGHADRVGPLRDYCIGLMMPVQLPDGRRVFAPEGSDPEAVRQHVLDREAAR